MILETLKLAALIGLIAPFIIVGTGVILGLILSISQMMLGVIVGMMLNFQGSSDDWRDEE